MKCIYCDEEVKEFDKISPGQSNLHWECGLRSVIGGVNHLNGLCVCYGGTLPNEPDGVSKREGARMSAQVYMAREGYRV